MGAEDVNVAAGDLDDFKREDFQRDTESETDQEAILGAFNAIKEFCLKSAKSNCFLVEKDFRNEKTELVPNLVDLKFLHRAQSRVTVRNRTGRLYDAYMLDISQYTGSRAIRNFDIIDFWGKDSDDSLRKASFIYAEKPITPAASP